MKKTIKIKELKKQYEFVCNEYIKVFCDKQEIDFDGWVADEVGGIASFACQYFFNLSDIILDIDTNQPRDLILNWQSDGVDAHFSNSENKHINYKSYTMGLRYKDL